MKLIRHPSFVLRLFADILVGYSADTWSLTVSLYKKIDALVPLPHLDCPLVRFYYK